MRKPGTSTATHVSGDGAATLPRPLTCSNRPLAGTRASAYGSKRMPCGRLRVNVIRQVVAKQEAIGLHAVTDGEFRRAWWHFDYLAGLAGVELAESEHGIVSRRADEITEDCRDRQGGF